MFAYVGLADWQICFATVNCIDKRFIYRKSLENGYLKQEHDSNEDNWHKNCLTISLNTGMACMAMDCRAFSGISSGA
jgi:hypothetical protein